MCPHRWAPATGDAERAPNARARSGPATSQADLNNTAGEAPIFEFKDRPVTA